VVAITRMRLFETGARRRKSPAGRPGHDLLFSALFAAALAQPTNEPSDHERGQQERDDHAHADEHIGENDSGAVLDGHGARRRSASMPRTVSRADRLAGSFRPDGGA
jgi:hypothetical protein